MYRINIYWNCGKTADGRNYKVPHTIDFGYDLTISLNGNMRSKVQKDNDGTEFIIYDPRKARIKAGNDGYLVLHVID